MFFSRQRMRSRSFVTMTLIAALTILVTASLASIGARRAEANQHVVTYGTFQTNQPVVALTFDVTFDRGDAAQVLNTLASRGVRATFALTGVWAQDNPDLVRRMVNEGHHLMNHTWDHQSLTGEYTGSQNYDSQPPLNNAEVINQLQRTENLIRQQFGVELAPYVRPPYGDYSSSTLDAFAQAGYRYNIMWTVDTLGWHQHPVQTVTQRALNAAQPGANILMHIGHGSTDAAALPGIIDGLRNMGYSFATVEDFVEGNLSQPQTRYFPQTDQELSGDFLRYWEQYGGVEILGYPVTGEIEADGATVQYFERARLEHRPGTWPARYDIHLTRIGAVITEGRRAEAPFQPVSARNDEHCTYFPETRHRLCGGFRNFWRDYGGLAVFGYPISEEFREVNADTGETYVVQYFERQRFEWHPGEWPERHDVFLGRLGVELLRMNDAN